MHGTLLRTATWTAAWATLLLVSFHASDADAAKKKKGHVTTASAPEQSNNNNNAQETDAKVGDGLVIGVSAGSYPSESNLLGGSGAGLLFAPPAHPIRYHLGYQAGDLLVFGSVAMTMDKEVGTVTAYSAGKTAAVPYDFGVSAGGVYTGLGLRYTMARNKVTHLSPLVEAEFGRNFPTGKITEAMEGLDVDQAAYNAAAYDLAINATARWKARVGTGGMYWLGTGFGLGVQFGLDLAWGTSKSDPQTFGKTGNYNLSGVNLKSSEAGTFAAIMAEAHM